MEFEIKGQQYRAARLDVFQQLKVSRKLLPLIFSVLSEYKSIYQVFIDAKNEGKKLSVEKLMPVFENVLPALADKLADIPEENVNAILHPCLSVVSRRTEKANWAPVFTQGSLMFDDIDLITMLTLVAHVVSDSLGNFFPTLPENVTPGQ